MKDDRGMFYYPFPQNKLVRMYVDQLDGEIRFRMWNQEDPDMWQQHGWVPYGAILQAASMYKGDDFDPGQAYDIELAGALLKEEGK